MSSGDEDRTVVLPKGARPSSGVPFVEVHYTGPDGQPRQGKFTRTFIVGRGEDCDLRLVTPEVSRHHLEIYPGEQCWWVRDLDSRNGILVNGRPVDKLQLVGTITLELGHQGPRIRLLVPAPTPAPTKDKISSLEEISNHYFGAQSEMPAGEHTMLVRQAVEGIKRRQSRAYLSFLFVAFALLAAVSGVALFQYLQLQKMADLANDIFYGMKELELHVVNLESELGRDREESRRIALLEEISKAKRKLASMREDYEAYARELRASRLIPPDSEELLILHMARVFGETEVDVPGDFISKVKEYVKKWQSSSRLENAVNRLAENNYAPTIISALASQELPPQFIYVALQETNFQPRAVGPRTRYGHAKGMWQFIPSTGARYGLKLGPLKDSGSYDPGDDRHDFKKASYAAARYLKDIYRTDAQASGLLVMASYNWGEGNVIKRLRKMPENPRERNFWQLLRHHKIPKETYDYVFYIFSAAVILENPRMFGFELDNPLRNL